MGRRRNKSRANDSSDSYQSERMKPPPVFANLTTCGAFGDAARKPIGVFMGQGSGYDVANAVVLLGRGYGP